MKTRKIKALKIKEDMRINDVIFLNLQTKLAKNELEQKKKKIEKMVASMSETARNKKEFVEFELKNPEYSFERLEELQSKLMLISGQKIAKDQAASGKGAISVQKFIDLFDSVQRLAKNYLQLLSDGILVFEQMKFSFFCAADEISPAGSAIKEKFPYLLKLESPFSRELVVRKEIHSNSSRMSSNGSETLAKEEEPRATLSIYLNKINEFFEKCIEEWKDLLNSVKMKFYELNYFNVKQIIILCKG